MESVVIVHFAPIELYPPVQNLVRTIERGNKRNNVYVLTTRHASDMTSFVALNSNIKLYHLAKSGNQLTSFKRYLNYILFYVSSLLILILQRPKSILYYETISCWPVYIYKRFINTKCRVFIHFHEYISPSEYKQGTLLLRYFHYIEKWLLPISNWVSHTNKYRLDLFVNDIAPLEIRPFILPNYPPRSWQTSPRVPNMPLRIVYAGALGLDTMYVKEFANWISQYQGLVIWDIFSANLQPQVTNYLNEINAANIRIYGGVPYEHLSNILKTYDVGIILYNGHIPNYVYNAPNKLFEYIACGLDVWFPKVMLGSVEFEETDHTPKVLALDFTQLHLCNPIELADRMGMSFKTRDYYCEEAFGSLIDELD